jgi:HCOMODA/2-hydroxy-3-carboxy-muconic semialdehyde decarboxylase
MGRALAGVLADKPMVLMRGHGATIVAPTLTLAVYRAIYAALNAKLQMDALRLGGEVTYLSDDEVALCVDTVENTNERAWAMWKKQAMSKRR